MMKLVLFSVLVAGCTAELPVGNELNLAIDEVVLIVESILHDDKELDSVPIPEFSHKFAFEIFGKKLPGVLNGTEGSVHNLCELDRIDDVKVEGTGEQKNVSFNVAFDDLEFEVPKYSFWYIGFSAKGGLSFDRWGSTARVQLVARKSHSSCSLTAQSVSLTSSGTESDFDSTGDHLPERYFSNVQRWTIEEFQKSQQQKQLEQNVLAAFNKALATYDPSVFCKEN